MIQCSDITQLDCCGNGHNHDCNVSALFCGFLETSKLQKLLRLGSHLLLDMTFPINKSMLVAAWHNLSYVIIAYCLNKIE